MSRQGEVSSPRLPWSITMALGLQGAIFCGHCKLAVSWQFLHSHDVRGACRAAKRVKGPKTGGAPKQSKGPSSSPQNYKSAGPVKEG